MSETELTSVPKNDKLLSSTTPSEEQGNSSDTESTTSKDSAESLWYGPIAAGSLRGGIISMIACTFGAGCLTFPYAFSRVGLLPGLALLVFVSGSMGLMLHLLIKAALKAKTFSFSGLALNSLGQFWNTVYNICSIILLMGAIMNYMFTSYQMIEQFVMQVFGYDIQPYRMYLFAICCFAIQIPLSLLRDMSKLQYASLVASIMIFIVIMIIAVESPFYFMQNMAEGLMPKMYIGLSWDYLDAVAIIMFGYMNHNAILQILSEVKKPTLARCKKVINRSWVIELIFYLLISLGGYFSTLDNTPSIFIKRADLKGFSPDYFIIASRCIIAICLSCLIPLRWNLMRESVASMCKVEKLSVGADIIVTIVGMIGLNTIVYFVDILTIIGFIGGVVTVMISFAIPLFSYVKYYKKKSSDVSMKLGYVIFFIFLFIGTGATVKSVLDFLK